MKSFENLVGKKFNYVTVLSLNEKRDNRGTILWNCVCDCGKEMLVRTFNLKRTIKSCGCKNDTRKKNMALNQKYAMYRRDIIKKGLEWNLTKEQFFEMSKKDCYYCGSKPVLWSPYINFNGEVHNRYKNIMSNDYMKGTQIEMNGIDRLNSLIGYNINNCVPCCTKCNIMKNAYSENDFLLQIKKIYEFKKLSENELNNKIECEITNFVNKSKNKMPM